MYVYSLDIPFSRVSADCTIYTPGIGNSLLHGLISSGENSAHFLQLMTYHNAISHFTILHFFRSTRYPSLLGGQRRSGMRGFAQHLYTQVNFSDLRELVTLPCATIVSDRPLASINRCFTVIQGQWLVPLDATRQRHHICP